MDQTTKSLFPKKSLPILLSISAFSILFSFSFLPISDFSNQMRSYITDRNYIFLFFNGILVLIIKSSGLASNSPSNSENKHEFVEKRPDQAQPVAELAENKGDYGEVIVAESKEEQAEAYEILSAAAEEEDEYEYEGDDEDDLIIIEDEGFGSLSTEELNKKCDDFIRKMRQRINNQA